MKEQLKLLEGATITSAEIMRSEHGYASFRLKLIAQNIESGCLCVASKDLVVTGYCGSQEIDLDTYGLELANERIGK